MIRRDRIYFVILSVILANVTIWLGYGITTVYHNPASAWYWARLIVDIVALIAILFLMRTYMKGRKIAKQREKELKDASK